MTPTTMENQRMSSELARQIHALSRDGKENLLVLLQEDLDGGPFVGDLPIRPSESSTDVKAAWATTIARRIDEMRTGRTKRIDAHGSAFRLLKKMQREHAP
jgi:hypothetical protein